jgi:hypothetical protein
VASIHVTTEGEAVIGVLCHAVSVDTPPSSSFAAISCHTHTHTHGITATCTSISGTQCSHLAADSGETRLGQAVEVDDRRGGAGLHPTQHRGIEELPEEHHDVSAPVGKMLGGTNRGILCALAVLRLRESGNGTLEVDEKGPERKSGRSGSGPGGTKGAASERRR